MSYVNVTGNFFFRTGFLSLECIEFLPLCIGFISPSDGKILYKDENSVMVYLVGFVELKFYLLYC